MSEKTRRVLIRLLILIAVVEVALPLLLLAFKDRMVFFPSRRPPPEAGLREMSGMDAELVRVRRPDGRELAAYDVSPRGRPEDGPVVLFLHGNAGNIAHRAGLIAWFAHGIGARVLMPDYSGYGGNAGSPSEQEVVIDGLAAFDHLVAAGVPPERIVIYGESLGGAVAVQVGAQRSPAAVVAQSSFRSLSSMALRVYPFLPLASVLVRGSFDSAGHAAALDCPLVVFHGGRDRIVPTSEGRDLAAAAGAEFVEVPAADHNDFLEVAGEAYLRDLGDRIRLWTRSGTGPAPDGTEPGTDPPR